MENQKVIVYTQENGNAAVCYPTGEIPVEAVQAKDIPPGVQSFIVDKDSLPNVYNDFFDAWEQNNGVVTVNLDKAKNLTKNRLRQERESLLTLQDIAFQKALEKGDSTAAIVLEKQRLRDLPTLTDSCTTLDQLRALKATQ